MTDERTEHQPWPLRALILLAVGASFGLLFDALVSRENEHDLFLSWTDDPLRLSLAVAVAISGLLFAFTLERTRWAWSIAFALLGGAVLGLIYYWHGDPDGTADQMWRFVSGLLAVAVAAPLFQTIRDEGRRRLPYETVHAHSWTNVVLWFAAWAFVLVAWLLAQLLAELFQLIGIELLRDALEESWFTWMLVCGALGAAIGLLRDRDRVLGLLQRVVTTVLSFLAPVLAVGLVVFVLALPFTGLAPLWDQTRATTPILLSCVIGAIILANAVIGNSPQDEAKAAPLRWSAMALAAVMLPLVAVAAVSTGLRIDQHGLTPARLWAIVFIVIAAAYAALYLLALILGRRGWSERLRPYNLYLAFGVCGLALLLATPLVNFGALSASDQLARLQSGRLAPDEFDWEAMRFDFGSSGRRALERLSESANADVRRRASEALNASHRFELDDPARERTLRAQRQRIRVVPAGTPVPTALRDGVADGFRCLGGENCHLLYQPGADTALLVVPGRTCSDAGAVVPRSRFPDPCEPEVVAYYRDGDVWNEGPRADGDEAERRARYDRIERGMSLGAFEVRTVPRRQLYIGGEPVGEAFE